MEKLSYLTSTDDVTGEYTTIPALLEKRAAEGSTKEAYIIYKGEKRVSITHTDLYDRCRQFACALTKLGMKKADVVVIEMTSILERIIVELSVMMIGAIPLGAYIACSDASDLRYIVKKSRAVAIFTDNSNSDALSTISDMVVSEEYSHLLNAVRVGKDLSLRNIHSFLNLYQAEQQSRFDRSSVYIDPDDPALILRTSGTTGTPKLVLHSHRSFLREKIIYKSFFHSNEDVKFMTNLSFSGSLGSVTFELVSGWCRVAVYGDFSLKPDYVAKCIEREGCQVALLSSDVLHGILKQFHGKLPSCIQALYFGGSPFKTDNVKHLNHLKCLINMYGSTEFGIFSGESITDYTTLENNMAGYPAPGVDIKIVDNSMRIVERGTRGRIYGRHKYRFLRYFNDEEMTKRIISPADWYDTQDSGYISSSGKLFVIGRKQDDISRGHLMVHCSELEAVYTSMMIPEISDIMVVPVPDNILGNEVCACVIKKRGVILSEDELKTEICQRIKRELFRPRYVVFVEKFPVNNNGKLSRKEMTKQVLEMLDLKDN